MLNKEKNKTQFLDKRYLGLLVLCLIYSMNIFSQEATRTITGNVCDMSGEPLYGATVMLKGSTIGTITDIQGSYQLKVPNNNDNIIEFTYIGFIAKSEKLGNRKLINIILNEDVGQLDEVVVVGYGTQKKASVIGAITTIEPQKLNVGTSRSLSNNLAGNLGGIIGVQRSGEPGFDNSEFWIRGISTWGGSRSPLILIDGIERSINNIELQEIESMSVLKDASASAVYGVRGANGVILLTTKRGKAGKMSVNFRAEHAITAPTQLPEFLGSTDYLKLLNYISYQESKELIYDPNYINLFSNGYDTELYPNVDWLDEITKSNANNTRLSLDISGGNERLRYSFVGAYYGENGILERDKSKGWDSGISLDRFNMRTNVDLDLTRTTLIRFNIGGYLQKRNTPPDNIDGLFTSAFETPPFVHPTIYESGQIPRVEGRQNPWARATQRGYQRISDSKLESLFSVEQDLKIITPGLKAKIAFSFDTFSSNGVKRAKDPDYYTPAKTRDEETGDLKLNISSYGQDFLGYETLKEWGNNSTYFEGSLNYSRTFNNHAVDAMILYNQRSYDDGSKLPFRNQGLAGRASYTYGNRYIAEVNFGYNGSENFSKEKRFGFFPSAAIGWIITEEEFMKQQDIFSKIKIRASYGLAGNDRLDGRRFAYITTITDGGASGGYKWGNLADFERSGRWEGHIGNTNLTWETVTKSNLGLELGIFNGMIDLQMDLFKEQRRDIFMERRNYPASAGFASFPWENFGKVDNQGVEATLDLNKQFNKDLFLSVRGTVTYAQNKIIEQDEAAGVLGTSRSSTGKPVDQIFGLIAEGLYTESDFINSSTGKLIDKLPTPTFSDKVLPGDIKYKDLNEDGVINELDRTAIGGTTNPQLVYGFGASLRYKMIDFGVQFQGNGKTYRMIGRSADFIPGSNMGTTGNIYSNAFDSWTENDPRQDAFYPRLHYGRNSNNSQESTWWLKDMSMLRLKNIELGVTIPKSITKKLAMEHARIYLRGANLICFSNFKMWDPEISSPNNNGLMYPIMKSVSGGIEVSF